MSSQGSCTAAPLAAERAGREANRGGPVKVLIVYIVAAGAAEELGAREVQRQVVACAGAPTAVRLGPRSVVARRHEVRRTMLGGALQCVVAAVVTVRYRCAERHSGAQADREAAWRAGGAVAGAPGSAAAWPWQCCRSDLAVAAQCRHTVAGAAPLSCRSTSAQ
jgi:hypothetical protein